MATLNFSFAGESINAARFEPKLRKFDLEFENPAYAALQHKASFSVESFFSINKYAEELSEAFHLAAGEAGIRINSLKLSITGNLDSAKAPGSVWQDGTVFNKIEVALLIASDAPYRVLEEILRLANELSPVNRDIADQVQLRFSLNSIVHLN